MDSGASQHMCRERHPFTKYSPLWNKFVVVGNGSAIRAHGCGKVERQVYEGRQWIDTTIDNILYVPELQTNLLSVNCVTDRGHVMITDDNKCKLHEIAL